MVHDETTHPPRRLGRPPNVVGAETRARLLRAALELFGRQGYTATSVRQVAEAVGLRDSAIYAHFAGKREIYDSLVDEYGPGLLRRLDVDGARLATRPPERALPELVNGLIEVWDVAEVRLATSMFIREGLDGIDVALAEVRGQLGTAFETWRQQGRIRDDADLDLLVWELVSPLAATRLLMLHGDASVAERRTGIHLAQRHAAYFVDTVVRDPGPPAAALDAADERSRGDA